MLVLSRKESQKIHIGDDIVITVTQIKGGKVKLGVQAPVDCKIYREEIYDRIKQEEEAEITAPK